MSAPTDAEVLNALIKRVCEANVGECDERLNEDVALALGWHLRRVTFLGLNGRTPGSWLWFSPTPALNEKGRRKPPQLLNSRHQQTLAALRALLNQDQPS